MAKARLRLAAAPQLPPLVLLTLGEVATRLELSSAKVASLIEGGEIEHCLGVSGEPLVAVEDIAAFGEKQKEQRRARLTPGPKRGANPIASWEAAILYLDSRRTRDELAVLTEAVDDALLEMARREPHGRTYEILESANDADGLLAALLRARNLVGELARDSVSAMTTRADMKAIRDNESALNILAKVVARMQPRHEAWMTNLLDGSPLGAPPEATRRVVAACRHHKIREPDAPEMAALAIVTWLERPTGAEAGDIGVERARRVKRWAQTLGRARRQLPHVAT